MESSAATAPAASSGGAGPTNLIVCSDWSTATTENHHGGRHRQRQRSAAGSVIVVLDRDHERGVDVMGGEHRGACHVISHPDCRVGVDTESPAKAIEPIEIGVPR